MHIPDGFIANARIWMGCFAVAVPTIAYATRRSRDLFAERAALLPGITGAFVFAAQMFNFPIAGGTSGHLLGGVLACVLLGGWTGMLVTALVIVIQCLLFQDGGITALGANMLNMAIVGGGGSFLLYRWCASRAMSRSQRLTVLGLAAGIGVVASAACAGLEIGLSGVVPIRAALTAMVTMHVPIGIAEGMATAAIVGAVERLRPDLVHGLEPARSTRGQLVLAVGLVVVLALLATGLASSAPDGLEHAAALLGFESRAVAAIPAPFPDYRPGIHNHYLARAAVVLFGLAVVAIGSSLVILARRRPRESSEG